MSRSPERRKFLKRVVGGAVAVVSAVLIGSGLKASIDDTQVAIDQQQTQLGDLDTRLADLQKQLDFLEFSLGGGTPGGGGLTQEQAEGLFVKLSPSTSQTIQATADSITALTIKGTTTPAVDILRVQSSTGTDHFKIDRYGAVVITPSSINDPIGLTIRANAVQTADLLEIQDNAATPQVFVTSDFGLFANAYLSTPTINSLVTINAGTDPLTINDVLAVPQFYLRSTSPQVEIPSNLQVTGALGVGTAPSTLRKVLINDGGTFTASRDLIFAGSGSAKFGANNLTYNFFNTGGGLDLNAKTGSSISGLKFFPQLLNTGGGSPTITALRTLDVNIQLIGLGTTTITEETGARIAIGNILVGSPVVTTARGLYLQFGAISPYNPTTIIGIDIDTIALGVTKIGLRQVGGTSVTNRIFSPTRFGETATAPVQTIEIVGDLAFAVAASAQDVQLGRLSAGVLRIGSAVTALQELAYRLQNLGADPTDLPVGRTWFDTVLERMRLRRASTTKSIAHTDDAMTPTAHKLTHVSGGSDAFVGGDLLDATARLVIRKNTGADVGTRRRLNFIEGTNVTLTIVDDGASEEVDVTIAASGGAGADVEVNVFEAGVQVGSVSRALDFTNANDFAITEDTINDQFDISINRNVANGLAGLDGSAKVALAQITEVLAFTNLIDVVITSAADGHRIHFDGTNWINLKEEHQKVELFNSKTKTNIGTAYVDIWTALDPDEMNESVDFRGYTHFRIRFVWNYVGAGTQQVRFVDKDNNANVLYESAGFTADQDPNDSGWTAIPAAFDNAIVNIEMQGKSTTGTDDPIAKGWSLYLR